MAQCNEFSSGRPWRKWFEKFMQWYTIYVPQEYKKDVCAHADNRVLRLITNKMKEKKDKKLETLETLETDSIDYGSLVQSEKATLYYQGAVALFEKSIQSEEGDAEGQKLLLQSYVAWIVYHNQMSKSRKRGVSHTFKDLHLLYLSQLERRLHGESIPNLVDQAKEIAATLCP
jgi:hypothetical protein